MGAICVARGGVLLSVSRRCWRRLEPRDDLACPATSLVRSDPRDPFCRYGGAMEYRKSPADGAIHMHNIAGMPALRIVVTNTKVRLYALRGVIEYAPPTTCMRALVPCGFQSCLRGVLFWRCVGAAVGVMCSQPGNAWGCVEMAVGQPRNPCVIVDFLLPSRAPASHPPAGAQGDE